MAEFWDKLKKDFQVMKDVGFKPANAAADTRKNEAQKQYGTQLQDDLKLSPIERRKKLQQGFENR